MLPFRKTSAILLLALVALLDGPVQAALILRYDLQSVCYMSSYVVEASLVRCHQPGRPLWSDTCMATVLKSLEGTHKAGDQIEGLNMELYDPSQISRHCILFLAPAGYLKPTQTQKGGSPEVVDMMLIDNKGLVHCYHQQNNPGSLVADYSPHQSYPALAEEYSMIMSTWAVAKKLKTPPPGLPYRVLHQTER